MKNKDEKFIVLYEGFLKLSAITSPVSEIILIQYIHVGQHSLHKTASNSSLQKQMKSK
jgi:hypothetical protein